MVSRDDIGVFTSFRNFCFMQMQHVLLIFDKHFTYIFGSLIVIYINDNALLLDQHLLIGGR